MKADTRESGVSSHSLGKSPACDGTAPIWALSVRRIAFRDADELTMALAGGTADEN